MSLTRVNRYQITNQLGHGGMAIVLRGYDPLFKREIAIKMLTSRLMHDPEIRTRFAREAKIIAGLEHPAIVPVYDYGEDNSQPYIVMRLMLGGSLKDRISAGGLSLEKTVWIVQRLASALDLAHSRGIVHRDLKPANILFDDDGNPYVSDFGIAKIVASDSGVTKTGDIIGTPGYMSPEQAKSLKELDGRSDVYALGVMVYEMLTGRKPYEAKTEIDLILKHVQAPPPRILEVKPSLPPESDDVIQKAMAKNREERYQTAGALAQALGALSSQSAPNFDHRLPAAAGGEGSAPAVVAEQGLVTKVARVETRPAGQSGQAPVTEPAPTLLRRPTRRPNWAVGATVALTALVLVGISSGLAVAGLSRLSATATQAATSISRAIDTPSVAPTGTAAATLLATHSAATIIPSTATATATVPPSQVARPGLTGRIAFFSTLGNGRNISLINPDGTGWTEVLLPEGSYGIHLTWSPDGQRLLIYIQDNFGPNNPVPSNSAHSYYLVNSDGSGFKRIALAPHLDQSEYCSWSPNGREIACQTANGLYLVDASDGSLTFLTQEARNPQWSPDGQLIAFEARIDKSNYGIYVIHIDGTGAPTLVAKGFGPQWSPDGQLIALRLFRDTTGGAGGTTDIEFVRPDGAHLTRLTSTASSASSPNWLEDSFHLVYGLDYGTDTGLFLATTDGKRPIRLTMVGGSFSQSSPNGKQFAFCAPGATDTYIADADGSHPMQLASSCAQMAWSPDSRLIAYTDSKSLYVSNADGTGKRRLADQVNNFQWSPGGNVIALTYYWPSGDGLYLINPDGTDLTRVIVAGFSGSNSWAWAP